MADTQRVGVIGLGNIGGGVARNLVASGESVAVLDLDPDKVDQLVELGASTAASVSDLGSRCDVMFTSLPGPAQIAAVGQELIAAMRPGSVWVELSTNDLDTARSLAARCAQSGIDLIDAPVSGGPEGAAAASLAIFVGGADDAVARISTTSAPTAQASSRRLPRSPSATPKRSR